MEGYELGSLTIDFYQRLAGYFKKMKEKIESSKTDSFNVHLLRSEMNNAEKMLTDVVERRNMKLAKKLIQGRKIDLEHLPAEESKLYSDVFSSFNAHKRFLDNILQGVATEVTFEKSEILMSSNRKSKAILRFLKQVPSIIGSDMKTYGPFKAEDVASVPEENAKILIKQGLAKRIEMT